MEKSNLKAKTCCFTGHRNIPDSEIENIQLRLKVILENLINCGIIFFGFGGACGFDVLAAKAVLDLKETNSYVKLILVQPCLNQTRFWPDNATKEYNLIKSKCDKVKCLSEKYYNGCMQVRNKHLVNNSSVCIAYLTQNSGGTLFTVNYARSKGLKIYNLADDSILDSIATPNAE